MLSLVGSIQPDPFAPEHVPDHSVIAATSTIRRHSAAEGAVVAPEAPVTEADIEAFILLAPLSKEIMKYSWKS